MWIILWILWSNSDYNPFGEWSMWIKVWKTVDNLADMWIVLNEKPNSQSYLKKTPESVVDIICRKLTYKIQTI